MRDCGKQWKGGYGRPFLAAGNNAYVADEPNRHTSTQQWAEILQSSSKECRKKVEKSDPKKYGTR